MEIGSKIKKYRELKSISQEELAQKVFVSRQTISNWETNKYYPDIKSLTLLANTFEISLDDFIKEDMEEIKMIVEEEKIKRFHRLGTLYSIELLVLVVGFLPLLKWGNRIGISIWLIILFIAWVTAFMIEKFKRDYNIQTYKELISFEEGKILTHDEMQQELGKRTYQKFFIAIIVGVITIAILVIMDLLLAVL